MRLSLASLAGSILACMALVSCQSPQLDPKRVVKAQPTPAPLPVWTKGKGRAGIKNARHVQFAIKLIELSWEQGDDLPKREQQKTMNEAELQKYLRSLAQKKGADIMSSPTVTTVEGESAQVRIGREFLHPKSADDPNKISKEFVGVTNYVRARPSSRGRKLRVNVLAEVKEFEGFNEEEKGFARPIFSTRRASCDAHLASGQTIVIGGVVTEDEQVVEDKVPILGDIPLLGSAFRNRETQKIWRELIVVVTPTVVKK